MTKQTPLTYGEWAYSDAYMMELKVMETAIETKEVAPFTLPQPLDWDTAGKIVEALWEFYHGYDYAEDAFDIARIVVGEGYEDDADDAAERLLSAIGFMLGMVLDWDVSPELLARVKGIRRLALPGVYGD